MTATSVPVNTAVVVEEATTEGTVTHHITHRVLGAKQFLSDRERGVYTVARTTDKVNIVELQYNLHRLLNGFREFHKYHSKYESLKDQEDQATPLDPSPDENENEQLRTSTPGTTPDTARSVTKPDATTLRTRILRACDTALKEFHKSFDGEAKLTILITKSGRIMVHTDPLPASGLKGCTVGISAGSPRSRAEVKDSQWVRDRAPIEATKPPHAHELLLTDADGNIYEGLTSNFYVIKTEPPEKLPHSTITAGNDGDSEDQPCRWIIATAAPPAVLEGIMLRVVKRVCEGGVSDLVSDKDDEDQGEGTKQSGRVPGVEFRFEFPRVQEAREGKWIGCFITSATRMVLPVDRLLDVDGR
ncbi:hypothetical protein HK102_011194 [Quaeritorhiza haematococci]|nr:hypothetical protein HK102_011194 [Quaeritorhiza haematococci]